MFRTPHTLTDGEKKCLEPYWEETKGQAPRKNLIKLVHRFRYDFRLISQDASLEVARAVHLLQPSAE